MAGPRSRSAVRRPSSATASTWCWNDSELHPRTAVGIDRDKGRILLLVVDGRSSTSRGYTLVEEARLLRKLGAEDAINFDGGGSSTMVAPGTRRRRSVLNTPSDGAQRYGRRRDRREVHPALSPHTGRGVDRDQGNGGHRHQALLVVGGILPARDVTPPADPGSTKTSAGRVAADRDDRTHQRLTVGYVGLRDLRAQALPHPARRRTARRTRHRRVAVQHRRHLADPRHRRSTPRPSRSR